MNEVSRLKEYIEFDSIYQEWKKGENKNVLTDFDWFCVQHCQDIEKLLEENKKLKQWDSNKDSRNSRQRVANCKLIKENKWLKNRINKEMIQIDLDLKDMIIQSLRYALYRHTYALNQTCEYIKKHPNLLDSRVKKVMLTDIYERLKDNDLKDYEIADIRCLQIFIENMEE